MFGEGIDKAVVAFDGLVFFDVYVELSHCDAVDVGRHDAFLPVAAAKSFPFVSVVMFDENHRSCCSCHIAILVATNEADRVGSLFLFVHAGNNPVIVGQR